MKSTNTCLAAVLAAFGADAVLAQTQPWPVKPIRIIVPYAAGGAADQLARVIGDTVGKELKQGIVVDNKPGASGMIGGAACKSAISDGYTFCLFINDVVTVNPAIFKKVPYKAETDFIPVAYIAELGGVLPVSASLPVANLKELVTYAKSHPDTTNWASYGLGTTSHLVLELINKRLDSSITHVPYQGTPQMLTAVLTGEASATIAGYAQVQQYIDQKKMRAIATLGEKRLPQLPDVPTLAEQGIDFKATIWFGMFAPAGMPTEYVKKMNDAINKAVVNPASAKLFDAASFYAKPMSSAEFSGLVKRDTELWRNIVRQANISID